VPVFTPCRLLICINIVVLLYLIISYLVLKYFFLFLIFRGIFDPIFVLAI
jgi:hypothetical protein